MSFNHTKYGVPNLCQIITERFFSMMHAKYSKYIRRKSEIDSKSYIIPQLTSKMLFKTHQNKFRPRNRRKIIQIKLEVVSVHSCSVKNPIKNLNNSLHEMDSVKFRLKLFFKGQLVYRFLRTVFCTRFANNSRKWCDQI